MVWNCGCKKLQIWVTSIRQPIHGRHPLIGRSSTSLIWFYSFHFGWSRKKSALSNIPSMKRMCNSSWNSSEFNFILPLFFHKLFFHKQIKHLQLNLILFGLNYFYCITRGQFNYSNYLYAIKYHEICDYYWVVYWCWTIFWNESRPTFESSSAFLLT